MKAISAYIRMLSVPLTRQSLFFFLICFLITLSNNAFANQNEQSVLPAPVLSSEYYPCSRCHKQNGTEQEVHGEAFHESIRVTGHTEDNYDGCFGCHDRENRNKLRLFNSSKIDLALSSKLCGQCHSTNYKLWLSTLHGKVVGKWNGPQKITPCTTCHDPHHPGYAIQKPEPSPTPPEQTLWWRK